MLSPSGNGAFGTFQYNASLLGIESPHFASPRQILEWIRAVARGMCKKSVEDVIEQLQVVHARALDVSEAKI